MKPINSSRRKIFIITASFLTLILIVSIIFLSFNSSRATIPGNPGNTGGDYTPKNEVTIKNANVLYDYLGNSSTLEIMSIIKISVLYDTNITDDPAAPPKYLQFSVFDSTKEKLLKNDNSYTINIDNNSINQVAGVPWDYWFTFTTNDGRHFRLDNTSTSDGINHIYIEKTS